ncbi:hypothetical protein BC939DRAFT_444250 [Gamsiella multidivaricata]|uniref:uncharacterized protein n=1 Tax=Gamsiella multidivaricata TaxID=101098 RepID=UPI0022206010|nr:uncharacterized protein BC939DRAFT_444250 [Gamsiella multidivaricata]KAI7827994.1 hypothetical protein BC939DRAFT_444250 [Gamsiella multidivaricata]
MKTKVPSRAGQALEPFLRLKINPPKEPVFLNKIASWICGCSSRNRRRAHNPSEDAYEDACEDEDGNCGCDYTQSSYPTSPYTMSLNIYHQGSLCSDYNGIHIEPAESREREEGLVRCEKQLCAGIDSADAPTTISPPISPMDIGASGSADDEVAAIFRLQLELEWRLILDREQCMRAMERWDPTVYLRSVVPEKSIGVDWNSCGATEQQSTATVIVPPVHKTTSDAIPILSALTARNVNSEIAAQ